MELRKLALPSPQGAKSLEGSDSEAAWRWAPSPASHTESTLMPDLPLPEARVQSGGPQDKEVGASIPGMGAGHPRHAQPPSLAGDPWPVGGERACHWGQPLTQPSKLLIHPRTKVAQGLEESSCFQG